MYEPYRKRTELVYTVVFGEIPSELQPIVNCNVARWGMEVVRLPAIGGSGRRQVEAITIAADNYRWQRAAQAEEPEWWVDLDCKVLELPESVSPSMGFYPHGREESKPQPDTFLMYIDSDFARLVLAAAKDTSVYCWPRKVLRDWQGISMIPEECYSHLTYSVNRRRILPRGGKDDQGNGRAVERSGVG